MKRSLVEIYSEVLSDVNYFYNNANLMTKPERLFHSDTIEYLKIILRSRNKEETDLFQNVDDLSIEHLRPHHIVSCYVFGVALYKNCKLIRNSIDQFLGGSPFKDFHGIQWFRYTWLLISIFHDLGYAYENGAKDFNEDATMELPKDILGPKTLYDNRLFHNYANYRKCRFGVVDHGLCAGRQLYTDLDRHFQKRDKRKADKRRPINAYVSWVISCHNIYYISATDAAVKCYKQHNLHRLIESEARNIKLSEHPLLFLLALVDSVEPIKISEDVSILDKVKISIDDDRITFYYEDLNEIQKTKFRGRIQGLNSWITHVEGDAIIITDQQFK